MGSTFVTVLIRYSRAAEKLPNKPTRKNIFPILIVTVVLCDKSIKVYFFYKTLIRKDFHFVLIDNFVYFLFTYLEVNCTCSISIVSVTNPVAIKLFQGCRIPGSGGAQAPPVFRTLSHKNAIKPEKLRF